MESEKNKISLSSSEAVSLWASLSRRGHLKMQQTPKHYTCHTMPGDLMHLSII